MSDRIAYKPTKNPSLRTASVTLRPGERLLIVKENGFYKLGGQLEDVVQGHVLTEARPSRWCSISQSWIEE